MTEGRRREIFVDNFAGGGGASTGIEIAIGRSVDNVGASAESPLPTVTTGNRNYLEEEGETK